MTESSQKKLLNKFCSQHQIKLEDLNTIFELYASDQPEEEIETQLQQKYSVEILDAVAQAFINIK